MPDIKVKGYSGTELEYENVEKIWLSAADSTEEDPKRVPYTYGEIVEGVEVELDFSGGDQKISVPDGMLVKEATVLKPDTLLPENVRQGVEVAGITGDYLGDGEEVTVELDMEDGDQTIEPSEGKLLAKATVKKPETLVPENILQGVEIGGVVGSAAPEPETEETTVTLDFTDGDMKVTPSDGKLLSKVDIPKPETLVPENIAKDVTIAGVTGVHEGGGGSSEEDEFDIYASGGNNRTWHIHNIAAWVFFSNRHLRSETFPNVLSIGSSAFAYANITSVDFPKCQSIGSSAFAYAQQLTHISFPQCVSISSYAFYYASKIKSAVFPRCESCGSFAFAGASLLSIASFPLLQRIPSGMFAVCSSLSLLCMPTVKYVECKAFFSCKALSDVTLPNCESIYYAWANSVSYGAFEGAGVVNVSLPECTSIGTRAFAYCKISSVYLPKCSRIEASTFYANYQLQTLDLPECTYISANAFYSCTLISSIIAPKLSGVGSRALTLPLFSELSWSTIITLGSQAFWSCTNASLFNFPNLTYIDNYNYNFSMFNSYSADLKTVYIPKFSSKLQYLAMSCPRLDTIVIGGGVKGLGSSVIWNCTMLRSLYITSTVFTPINLPLSSVFGATPIYSYSSKLGTYGSIYVPAALYSTFISASYWSEIADRIVAIPDADMAEIRNGKMPGTDEQEET